MNSKKVLKKVSAIVLPILGAIVLKMLDNKEPEKYSDEWFATISDEEFYKEREPQLATYSQGTWSIFA